MAEGIAKRNLLLAQIAGQIAAGRAGAAHPKITPRIDAADCVSTAARIITEVEAQYGYIFGEVVQP